jgi:hypothetical protein
MLLELTGEAKDQDALEKALGACKGVTVKKMTF